MIQVYVDADGCPVKAEVYRVAERYGLSVTLVANMHLRLPDARWVRMVVVGDALDAADDWIADHVGTGDIVVTGDIPLAARCIERGAGVISPSGRIFDEASIGDVLANRNLLSSLRDSGMITGGPAPFEKQDRSRFLERLDALVHALPPTDDIGSGSPPT